MSTIKVEITASVELDNAFTATDALTTIEEAVELIRGIGQVKAEVVIPQETRIVL